MTVVRVGFAPRDFAENKKFGEDKHELEHERGSRWIAHPTPAMFPLGLRR
jgi:hypothetical protein